MTGFGDEDSVVQALRDGAINFLRKPLDIDQMLLAIQKGLDYQTLRRSLAYRNRDMELMQELVIRLTRNQEIVVETPGRLTSNARAFLQHLVDALPFGLLIVGADRNVLFANRHVLEKASPVPARLSAEYLEPLGITALSEEKLAESLARVFQGCAGSFETLMLTRYSFLVMTPVTLVGPGLTERFVALVIRGERKA